MSTYQPNWIAYAHAIGKHPSEVAGPSANARFMAFISTSWAEFTAETGTVKVGTPDWAERFSAWLTARYPEPQESTP